jgi:hypothetical protein
MPGGGAYPQHRTSGSSTSPPPTVDATNLNTAPPTARFWCAPLSPCFGTGVRPGAPGGGTHPQHRTSGSSTLPPPAVDAADPDTAPLAARFWRAPHFPILELVRAPLCREEARTPSIVPRVCPHRPPPTVRVAGKLFVRFETAGSGHRRAGGGRRRAGGGRRLERWGWMLVGVRDDLRVGAGKGRRAAGWM